MKIVHSVIMYRMFHPSHLKRYIDQRNLSKVDDYDRAANIWIKII